MSEKSRELAESTFGGFTFAPNNERDIAIAKQAEDIVKASFERKVDQAVAPLVEALEGAAKTAHYRGVGQFCHGEFKDCPNCSDWREALKGWKP